MDTAKPHTAVGEPDDDQHRVLSEGAWASLSAIAEQVGYQQVQALVDQFAADAAVRVNELRKATAAGDEARVRSIAHSLKGSSGTLGAVRVARLARAIERAALARVHEVDDLEREIDSAVREMCSRLCPETRPDATAAEHGLS